VLDQVALVLKPLQDIAMLVNKGVLQQRVAAGVLALLCLNTGHGLHRPGAAKINQIHITHAKDLVYVPRGGWTPGDVLGHILEELCVPGVYGDLLRGEVNPDKVLKATNSLTLILNNLNWSDVLNIII